MELKIVKEKAFEYAKRFNQQFTHPIGKGGRIMAWFAVDKDGCECEFEIKPIRGHILDIWVLEKSGNKHSELPKGTIERLTGRKLTWDNEPIELTLKEERR